MHRGHLPIAVIACTLVILGACRIDGPSRVEAPSDTTDGGIGFELAGQGGAALVVPVFLNGGGPYDFVLDTGATFTCISSTAADTLELPEASGRIGFGAGVGGSGSVQLVRLDSLRIGDVQAFDMTACVLDLSQLEQAGLGVDGLLGLNFLKSFHVSLDFAANTLYLRRP